MTPDADMNNDDILDMILPDPDVVALVQRWQAESKAMNARAADLESHGATHSHMTIQIRQRAETYRSLAAQLLFAITGDLDDDKGTA
jgi:hypothetical protein